MVKQQVMQRNFMVLGDMNEFLERRQMMGSSEVIGIAVAAGGYILFYWGYVNEDGREVIGG